MYVHFPILFFLNIILEITLYQLTEIYSASFLLHTFPRFPPFLCYSYMVCGATAIYKWVTMQMLFVFVKIHYY